MKLDARIRLFIILAGVFVVCLIVGDLIGGKIVETTIFGQYFSTTVGMIPFPVTFLLTDLLNEFYGKRAARFVTMLGFSLALMAYTFIFIADAIPIAAFTREAGWDGVRTESFSNVFLSSQRMILASLTAYIVAQFVDIGLFHFLRRVTKNRFLWLRVTGSTLVSQLIDTVAVSCVAWIGRRSPEDIANMVFTGYTLKIFIAVGLTPLVYIGHAFVERFLGIEPHFELKEGEVAVPSEENT